MMIPFPQRATSVSVVTLSEVMTLAAGGIAVPMPVQEAVVGIPWGNGPIVAVGNGVSVGVAEGLVVRVLRGMFVVVGHGVQVGVGVEVGCRVVESSVVSDGGSAGGSVEIRCDVGTAVPVGCIIGVNDPDLSV